MKQAGKKVFVFGSNLAGRHGAGSALRAVKEWGAILGCREGPQGNSYAIPTKDGTLKTLPLAEIAKSVDRFIQYANENQSTRFLLVKIGCGLAGYSEDQIAPMFSASPDNVVLPFGWDRE